LLKGTLSCGGYRVSADASWLTVLNFLRLFLAFGGYPMQNELLQQAAEHALACSQGKIFEH
jgi:hypothetical protein